jgi:hypothetical protein
LFERPPGPPPATTEHQLKVCDRLALLVEMLQVGPPGSLVDEVKDILTAGAPGHLTDDSEPKIAVPGWGIHTSPSAIETLAKVARMLHEIHPNYGCGVSAAAVVILPYPERDGVLVCNCLAKTGYCDMNLDPEKRSPPKP